MSYFCKFCHSKRKLTFFRGDCFGPPEVICLRCLKRIVENMTEIPCCDGCGKEYPQWLKKDFDPDKRYLCNDCFNKIVNEATKEGEKNNGSKSKRKPKY